jgi:Cu2+-exporting ATPase
MIVYAALKGANTNHEQTREAALNGRHLPSPTPSATSWEAQIINREFNLSLGVLGLTTVGLFGYPILTLIVLPLLAYQLIPVVRLAYEELVTARRVGGNTVRLLIRAIFIGLGSFQLASLWAVLYWGTEKLLLIVQDTSRQQLAFALSKRPRFVWVQHEDVEIEMPFENLRIGDIVVVHAGETVPLDGTITDGMASIDQRMLTGEAQPAEKGIGESVFAATIVLSGMIWVRVEKEGTDTVVAQIEDILHQTTNYTSTLELKGRAIADKSILPILGLTVITLPLLGLEAAFCVFACNFWDAIRTLASLSFLNYLNIAAKQGIIVKDGRALESLKDVDTVFFDKTGTLTQDQSYVAAIHPCDGYTATELLRYAAGAEVRQTHPFARAILQAAQDAHVALPSIDKASYEVGYGLIVRIDARQIRVGSARFMEREELVIPADLVALEVACQARGNSLVYVAIDETISGAIELHPTIRPEIINIVQGLRQRGLEVHIVSGDHEQPTQQLARALGIDHYTAEALPEDKAALIEHMQRNGKSVCFIGDGINDAIGLKIAHVSVSLSGASTIALDSAQIVFMDASLNQMLDVFELADDLDANMKNNLLTLAGSSGIILGGVYLLRFCLITTALVGFIGSIVGLTNAMLPAFTYRPRLTQMDGGVPSTNG